MKRIELFFWKLEVVCMYAYIPWFHIVTKKKQSKYLGRNIVKFVTLWRNDLRIKMYYVSMNINFKRIIFFLWFENTKLLLAKIRIGCAEEKYCLSYWKWNFRGSVSHNFLRGREVTLWCPHRIFNIDTYVNNWQSSTTD